MALRRKLPLLLLHLLVVMLVCSCQSTYYPTVVDIPMHQRKGEVRASGHVGVNGLDLVGSYAATSHLSVGFAANHLIEEYRVRSLLDYSSQNWEIKAGYWQKFKADTLSGFDLRLAYGVGRDDYVSRYQTPYIFGLDYHKLSLQPSLYIAGKYAEVGMAAKMTAVQEFSPRRRYDDIMVFVDPVALVRFGHPNFKLSLQLGASLPLYDYWASERPITLSVGADVRLNTRRK